MLLPQRECAMVRLCDTCYHYKSHQNLFSVLNATPFNQVSHNNVVVILAFIIK